MPKFFALSFLGIACLANAMQVPGQWDMFDLGAALMLLCAVVTAIFGE